MHFESTYVFVLTASGLKWSTNTLKASGPIRDNRRLLRASAVAVPSEENEPELQPVVSLPQQGSVGQEEKSDETVGGSETNVAQDKTLLGVWCPNRRPPARPYDKYLQDPWAK